MLGNFWESSHLFEQYLINYFYYSENWLFDQPASTATWVSRHYKKDNEKEMERLIHSGCQCLKIFMLHKY
jgi:hypothetical protein